MKVLSVSFLLMILCCGCASTQKQEGQSKISPALQGQPGDVVVLIFASPDCPISNALAPEYERQHQDMLRNGDRFYLIHARTDVTDAKAAKHASDYELTMPVIVDSRHELVNTMNATVTPEAVVLRFDDNGKWSKVYQGRINDLYASLGNRRDHATRFWLRDAVDAAAGGDSIAVAYREPLGCYIEKMP
ncbi:MAG: thioredoxin-like domain-containing protein [Phycisphaerales bacterium]|nr:thioredoxin-like domain-containing protein [Phycisphaerales bacterium]|tara:strand:+ start:2221 stop:2787 length:567 start_codon:yes stop_codon:yes gene_type:complete